MKDINGKIIKHGMLVRVEQTPGGIYPPAKAVVGYAGYWQDREKLTCRYKDRFGCFMFAHMEGQIVEILEPLTFIKPLNTVVRSLRGAEWLLNDYFMSKCYKVSPKTLTVSNEYISRNRAYCKKHHIPTPKNIFRPPVKVEKQDCGGYKITSI